MLVLQEQVDGSSYETRIYLYQGNLVEEYRRADESCQEDEAAVIAQTDTFEVSFVQPGLLAFETQYGKGYVAAVSYTHLDVYKRQCRKKSAAKGWRDSAKNERRKGAVIEFRVEARMLPVLRDETVVQKNGIEKKRGTAQDAQPYRHTRESPACQPVRFQHGDHPVQQIAPVQEADWPHSEWHCA